MFTTKEIKLEVFKSKPETDPDIIPTFRQVGTIPIRFNDPLEIEVDLRNIHEASIELNSSVSFQPSSFYDDDKHVIRTEVKPQSTYTFKISLKPRVQVTEKKGLIDISGIRDLQREIFVSVKSSKGVEYKMSSDSFRIKLENMVADLNLWKPVDDNIYKANILVFGPTGVGKSTLINHILSLWSSSYQSIALALNSQDHVTLSNEVFLSDINSKFRFLDTFGLNKDNYTTQDFQDIIKGATEMEFLVEKKEILKKPTNEQEMELNRPHSIIFVLNLNYKLILETKPEVSKRIKEFISLAFRSRLRPILVVTHADEIKPDETRKSYVDFFVKETGVTASDVFLVDNSINSENRKNFENDKILIEILIKTLNNCNTAISSRMRK